MNGAYTRLARSGARLSTTLRAVYERDDGRCWLCGDAVPWDFADRARRPTRDHVRPASAGGAFTAGNLRLAHARCNEARGAAGHASVPRDERRERRYRRERRGLKALRRAGYLVLYRAGTGTVVPDPWRRRRCAEATRRRTRRPCTAGGSAKGGW